jgi:hypothetical protein
VTAGQGKLESGWWHESALRLWLSA